ncbi:hypothetical protein SAMN05444164_3851 [Bradyrhizobium erythrophlei]|uniref:Uncharacterized protein n=1 Tax=Bradyrhizobium erythrophlei TaxID=1437360 RepID=A0A1H4Y9H0_9BRAD|nr:hypothetical protein SAMN05444164_3851 [Bradyrhizobium erythrophlei]
MKGYLIPAVIISVAALAPATAQTTAPGQSMQEEADKGVKTNNSGASGYVGDQERPGASAHPPGEPPHASTPSSATSSPNAQNSGVGISGAPGGKSGPAAKQGTVGSNLPVQEQDPANVKGLPGNKSGPPAKR